MEYSDKERGMYLLQYAERLDQDNYLKKRPRLLELYKARFREEGSYLIRQDRTRESDTERALFDDYVRYPEKFLDMFAASDDDVDLNFIIYDHFDEKE